MELFDLYNADRVSLGRTRERDGEHPENTYHIVVHCCIFSSDNRMLIQRRQDFKKGWSGMWDITCGGSAVAGENSQTAVQRELHEEMGINVDFSDNRPILTVHFDRGFDDIYVVNRDVKLSELTLQAEEVADAKWATEQEILQMIDDGVFIPYHEHLIGLLFFMRSKRGAFRREE